jgi:hypothetical protein
VGRNFAPVQFVTSRFSQRDATPSIAHGLAYDARAARLSPGGRTPVPSFTGPKGGSTFAKNDEREAGDDNPDPSAVVGTSLGAGRRLGGHRPQAGESRLLDWQAELL